MRLLLCALVSLCGIATSLPAVAQTVAKLPRYQSASGEQTYVLRDSKYGFIPKISQALASRLQGDCQLPDKDEILSALELFPQRLSSNTMRAIQAVETCRNVRLGYPDGLSEQGWRALELGSTLPSVWARTRALAFPRSQHTFDYDQTFWDLDAPRYRESIFTWGPLHATIGEGCTLLTLLRRANATPGLGARVRAEFETAEETAWLELVLNRRACTSGPEQAVKDATSAIYDDFARKDRFEDVFRRLADIPEMRRLYDSGYFGEGGWRVEQLKRYYDMYQKAGLIPSEVDFAFFIDHAVDTPSIAPVVDQVIAKARAEKILPSARGGDAPEVKANARFRRLFSRHYSIYVLQKDRAQALEAGSGKFDERSRFRRGRDAIYFIDSLWNEMTADERSDWIDHARIKASDVALAPDRAFIPCTARSVQTCVQVFSMDALARGE